MYLYNNIHTQLFLSFRDHSKLTMESQKYSLMSDFGIRRARNFIDKGLVKLHHRIMSGSHSSTIFSATKHLEQANSRNIGHEVSKVGRNQILEEFTASHKRKCALHSFEASRCIVSSYYESLSGVRDYIKPNTLHHFRQQLHSFSHGNAPRKCTCFGIQSRLLRT